MTIREIISKYGVPVRVTYPRCPSSFITIIKDLGFEYKVAEYQHNITASFLLDDYKVFQDVKKES